MPDGVWPTHAHTHTRHLANERHLMWLGAGRVACFARAACLRVGTGAMLKQPDGGSRCHYAIEPHGVTEEEVEGMRQELTVSNTFSIPSRQAASRDLPPAVTSMPPSERASYAAASYSTALAFPSSRPLKVVPSPQSCLAKLFESQAPSGLALQEAPCCDTCGPSLIHCCALTRTAQLAAAGRFG